MSDQAAPASRESEAPAAPPKNPAVVEAKARIQALKADRRAALESGDSAKLKIARRRIHRLKRKIRRAS